jgi:hypothetical protein
MVQRPAKVHVKLSLMHMMNDTDNGTCGGRPKRREKWYTVLKIDYCIVLVSVPPEMAGCGSIYTELAAFPYD